MLAPCYKWTDFSNLELWWQHTYMSLSLKIARWIHNQWWWGLLFFIWILEKQHKKEGLTKNDETMNVCPLTLWMFHLHLANSMELLSPSSYPIGWPFLAFLDMDISEAFKATIWVDFWAVTKAKIHEVVLTTCNDSYQFMSWAISSMSSLTLVGLPPFMLSTNQAPNSLTIWWIKGGIRKFT